MTDRLVRELAVVLLAAERHGVSFRQQLRQALGADR
jgi:hypothetical protein